MEPKKFYSSCPQCQVCVEVDLSKDLKESMHIQIGQIYCSQHVQYINIPDTCYLCQNSNHKIKDCSLTSQQPKPSTQPSVGLSPPTKDEGWSIMVNHKAKNPNSSKPSGEGVSTLNVSKPTNTGVSSMATTSIAQPTPIASQLPYDSMPDILPFGRSKKILNPI